jgi:dTDP-D-glucose 4,6-dehydratase
LTKREFKLILVTGGVGFNGANSVLDYLVDPKAGGIIKLDKLTYTD